MEGPRRRDDGLPVAHHEVAGGARLAQEVEDAAVLGQVDVEVDLGAAVVQVRRQRVPHRAVGEHCDAELQGGRLQLGPPGVAEQRPLAGARGGADGHPVDVAVDQRRGRVGGARGCGHEVEGGVGAGEGDLAAATDVQPVEVTQLELLPVDEDVTGLPDVDDTELTTLQVRLDAEHLGPRRQLEALVAGDRSPDDHPVVMRVDRVHLAGLEQVLDEEGLPQVRSVGRLHARR